FFPIALVFMVIMLFLPLIRPELTTMLSTGMVIVLWGGIAVCVVDSLFLRTRIRRQVAERFCDVERGVVGYGIWRADQLSRLPLIRPELTTMLSTGMVIVLWGGIAVCVVDSLFLRARIRRQVAERFGDVERGLVGYGIMRAIQIRRFRLPRAQIKHGQAPR